MKKSVLIISQNYNVGGLETYINTQIADLSDKGHKLYLMTNRSKEELALNLNICEYYKETGFYSSKTQDLFLCIDRIRKIIKEKKIDIVHVHPFNSVFPAVIASNCENIPCILTLHGPASINSFINNVYGQLAFIFCLRKVNKILCVSKEVEDIITGIIGYGKTEVFHNVVKDSWIKSPKKKISNKKKWLMASRLDEDKINGIINFIDSANSCDAISSVDIYGSGDREEFLKEYTLTRKKINMKGSSDDIMKLMPSYAGFAGMGRGIIEATCSGLSACLVGYDGIKGMLDDELFEKASYCNFSGRNISNIALENINFEIEKNISDRLIEKYKSGDKWNKLIHNILLDKIDSNDDTNYLYEAIKEEALHSDKENDCYLTNSGVMLALFECIVKYTINSTPLNKNILSSIKANDAVTCSQLENSNNVKDVNLENYSCGSHKINTYKAASFFMRFLYNIMKNIYWRLPVFLKKKLEFIRSYIINKKLSRLPKLSDSSYLMAQKLPDWVYKVNSASKTVFIPCSFEFDELVNQRPINAAKYFADKGYQVIFIAWQWSTKEILKNNGTVFNNIIQVPLFDFFNHIEKIDVKNRLAIFIATFPARIFLDSICHIRAQGGYIVYDIMDEWECFCEVGQAPWYEKEAEDAFVLSSDYVCAVTPALANKFSNLRQDISVVGNGYSEQVLGTFREIAAKDGRKVGYFGHLTDSWFDWDLLFQLALDFPEIQFEIIGYGEPDWASKKIESTENIHFIGKVLTKNLHLYIKNWSVGLIPFKKGKLAQAVDPIKIYEYIYFGVSVLVSGIPHTESYPRTYLADENNFKFKFKEALSDYNMESNVDKFLAKTTWQARFSLIENSVLCSNVWRKLYV